MMEPVSGLISKNKRRRVIFWLVLTGSCTITIMFELFGQMETHLVMKKPLGFHALFGFISCGALILLAKILGFILKVDESYYD